MVRISDLVAADSPRLGGVDHDHIRMLAGIDTPLPPICVHFETMSVIDGMHRLNAARLNGRDTIAAWFFHGSREDAFRLGVKANVAHGLPLTMADRQAAAGRIISVRPELSDRSIAGITGLAAKTVAAIRRRVSNAAAIPRRIGRDGRVRPLSTAEGRRIASEAIAARPDASLRQIARETGMSVGTVRDVRARIRAGQDPIPAPQRADRRRRVPPAAGLPNRHVLNPHSPGRWVEPVDIGPLLGGLCRDPSLRYTESGRAFLRWLAARTDLLTQWRRATDGVPPHCGFVVARIARECARIWAEMADELSQPGSEHP
jgi:hypothetical protein